LNAPTAVFRFADVEAECKDRDGSLGETCGQRDDELKQVLFEDALTNIRRAGD